MQAGEELGEKIHSHLSRYLEIDDEIKEIYSMFTPDTLSIQKKEKIEKMGLKLAWCISEQREIYDEFDHLGDNLGDANNTDYKTTLRAMRKLYLENSVLQIMHNLQIYLFLKQADRKSADKSFRKALQNYGKLIDDFLKVDEKERDEVICKDILKFDQLLPEKVGSGIFPVNAFFGEFDISKEGLKVLATQLTEKLPLVYEAAKQFPPHQESDTTSLIWLYNERAPKQDEEEEEGEQPK